MAKPGTGYDMFLSHTWHTPGERKFWSLLLAFNWHLGLLGCFVGVSVALLLYAMDAVPMPLIYVAQFQGFGEVCPLGPWALLLTPLCGASALLLSPYLPRRGSDNVFFDLACINQTNTELKEKGIYGIAGWLSVTDELRILWSPPYLSRLWCVFELAAYRMANPSGRITFQPIFVETLVLSSFFGIAAIQGTYLATLQFPSVQGLAGVQAVVCFGIILPLVHIVRSYMREKHAAVWQLENFDLTMVDCDVDFDRRFVYGAIRKWYGSEENFVGFVRGTLAQELEKRIYVIQVPWVYHLLTVCPYLGGWVDLACALWKGGAPSSCVLSFGIGMCLTCAVWATVSVELVYILSDFFAARKKSRLADFMVDLGILVVVALVVLMQTTASRVAYGAAPFSTPQADESASQDAFLCVNSIWASTTLLALVLAIAVLLFRPSLRQRLCRRAKHASGPRPWE
ncbi:unnamed protein product [Effrenium voratum]|nr:unnamed protein product [Effrenium voratum]CAJ1459141.1 unnamed protein product [Effrenium voratum]